MNDESIVQPKGPFILTKRYLSHLNSVLIITYGRDQLIVLLNYLSSFYVEAYVRDKHSRTCVENAIARKCKDGVV